MNTWRKFILIIQGTAAWIFLCGGIQAQTSARLSTTFMARGEQALLEITVAGEQPDDIPEIPAVPDVNILPNGRGARPPMRSRGIEYVYEYVVSGYNVGKHTIPAIEVMVDNVPTTTEPIEFEIFNPDELKWSEFESNGKIVRYATAFRSMTARPYENQSNPVEIKLFVPDDMLVEDWGIPSYESSGLTAWRFQPSGTRSRLMLLGQRYVSIAYPSTINPTRTGPISIGPANIRLISREMIYNPLPQAANVEIYVQAPKLEMEAIPLPPNPPEGFKNAVGSFRIAASTTQTEVTEGDPIVVDLMVAGTGNLDILSPPTLANSDGWKVYGTTKEELGDERRQLSGSIVYRQSIRALEMKNEIPSFRLVYFDPKANAYKSVMTEPIALTMKPNTAPGVITGSGVPNMQVPFERMSDILGTLPISQLTLPATGSFPLWVGHLLAGLTAAGLLAKAFWMRVAPKMSKNPDQIAKEKALRELQQSKPADEAEFLRAAGSFVETWLGDTASPEVKSILSERDAVSFRAEKSGNPPDPKRRNQILQILRKAALACVFLGALGMSPAVRADNAKDAQEAYDSAKYDEAIKLWLEAGDYKSLSADTLYNIGNACYRAGSPGQAALYYRRALARDSGHQEARQNLRFIERKYGSISVQRSEYQYAIAKFPLSAWKAVFWGGLWLCVISLLIFPATRAGARIRIAAVCSLVSAPILISAGILGWIYFPSDAEFAPLDQQAVVIEEKASLHTDAARTSPEVIDAPPGSLCKIISRSGRWAYVAFATKTRGWIQIEQIDLIQPEDGAAPPKFRKPKADGKTA